MISPSVQNFLKIFNFYSLNSAKKIKDLASTSYLYSDNTQKYFNSLNFGYEDGKEGLKYPDDQDAIQTAIASRQNLSTYFNKILYPGSYAFNTTDNKLFRTLIYDWASVIKTFQDSVEQCTDIYSLDSESVDKAIRGFGIDFINERTVTSLYRRQTFLINMCELYKIKGSPQSIIKALRIVGLNAENISEAWVYPTRDGKANVEIKWIPVKLPQEFNEIDKCYNDNTDNDYEYWTWGAFNSKLSKILECHWFYTKEEIIKLNWNKDPNIKQTFLHLPSITPYFNIKIKYDTTTQQIQNYNLLKIVNNQFKNYLNNLSLPTDINISGYNNISLLECYLSVVYILMRYYDYIRYNQLKNYIEYNSIIKIDYNKIEDNGHRYLQLIYLLYEQIYNTKNENKKIVFQQIVHNFEQRGTHNFDCSYNELLDWWLSLPHESIDDNCGIQPYSYQPSKILKLADKTNIIICWEEKYNRGYYDLQFYLKDVGWTTVAENLPVTCEYMEKTISRYYDGYSIDFNSEEADETKVRIVHYKTENNIPHIFIDRPFYFNNNRETEYDKVVQLNENLLNDFYYQSDAVYDFLKNNSDISSEEMYKNLYKLYGKQVRITDRDLQYRSFINSLIQFPNSIKLSDKEALINSTFYTYNTEYTYNYFDFERHEGNNLDCVNYNKYPENKKWNWAVSYGEDQSTSYFYLNYESNKWLRVFGTKLVKDVDVSLPEKDFEEKKDNNLDYNKVINSYTKANYGIPLYKDGLVYFKICVSDNTSDDGNYFVLGNDNRQIIETEWNALSYVHKEYDYDEELYNHFKKEYDEYCIMKGDKFEIILPPSDIYPSSIIPVQKTKNDLSYYLSDIFFKKDSKLARDVVVARIDMDICKQIYDDAMNGINQAQSEIRSVTVYNDPFYNQTITTYLYSSFIEYLYKNSYTIDINNGYIYKKFNYYLDENNYLYIKCIDVDNSEKIGDKVSYKWIRIKASRNWKKEHRESIYYTINEHGDKICKHNIGKITPTLTFRHNYDAERYLKDPVFKQDVNETAEDKLKSVYGYIDEDIRNILLINNGSCHCVTRRSVLNKTTLKENDIWVDESNIQRFDKSKVVLREPLMNKVNFGINSDLLDYINTKLIKSNTVDDYENTLIEFLQPLSNYCSEYLKFSQDLDLYSFTLYNSKLIKNIIKFYKPKRARHLILMTSIEGDLMDDKYSLEDLEHNILNENSPTSKKEKSLSNIKSTIRKEINEYIPFDDLIFVDNNHDHSVYSYREVIDPQFDIPRLEVYDKVDLFTNYIESSNGQKIDPAYYVTDFETNINGIYYQTGYNEYTNNQYYFVLRDFIFNLTKDPKTGIPFDKARVYKFTRWVCLNSLAYIGNEYIEPYDCLYISEEDIGETPYSTSDGSPLKYVKVENDFMDFDQFVHYFMDDATHGLFQIYDENNVFKINLRKLDPVFYFNSFPVDKYNGYYYESDKRYNDAPMYFNQHGMMITYCDLSDIDENYLIKNIGSYGTTSKKYWILTNYLQIPDYSDAEFITDSLGNNENIFEYDSKGYETGRTRMFYDASTKISKDASEIFFANGVYGYTMKTIMEHPEYVKENVNRTYKYEETSDRYSDIVKRRVSQNVIPETYEPNSYISFKFGDYLDDYYKKVNNNQNVTQVLFKEYVGSDLLTVKLNKSNYCTDYYGNLTGCLHIKKDNVLTLKFNENILSFHFRICTTKNFWDLYSIVKNVKKNHFWSLYFNDQYIDEFDGREVFPLIIEDVTIGNINISQNILTFNNSDIKISEFYTFDINVPEWYIKIMNEYGVYRFRPETSKKFLTYNSPNNFEPLFNTWNPRSIYGRFITGLPENVQGDRISSVKVTGVRRDFIPFDGETQTYKWNADSYYYPNEPKEVSDIWTTKIKNRIYDKCVVKTTESGHINGVKIIRNYKNITLPEKSSTKPERYSKFFTDGVEFSSPSNYINVHSDIPNWWVKDPDEFKTGAIHHNGAFIAVKDTLFDPYPLTGRNCVRYSDDGGKLDGYCNPCHNNKLYYSSTKYDHNTKYLLTPNLQADKTHGLHYGNNIYKNIDTSTGVKTFDYCIDEYNNYPEDNRGSNHFIDCTKEPVVNIFYDPNTFNVCERMKNNCIYHNTIKIKSGIETIDLEYKACNHVDFKKPNDYNCCYINETEYDSYLEFMSNHRLVTNVWEEQSDRIDLRKIIQVVPVQDSDSGYQYWEVRYCEEFLISEELMFTVDPSIIIESEITNVMCPDYSDNYYHRIVTRSTMCTNYITPRMSLEHNYSNYEMINGIQKDICGQRLCYYNPQVIEDLKDKPYKYIKQDLIKESYVYTFKTIELLHKKTLKRYPRNHFNFEMAIYNKTKDLINIENSVDRQKQFVVIGKELYIYNDSKWVGPFDIITKHPDQNLENINCSIKYILIDGHFYVRVRNDEWVEVGYKMSEIQNNYNVFRIYGHGNNCYINVPLSEDNYSECWSQYTNIIPIMSSIWRMFNYSKDKRFYNGGWDNNPFNNTKNTSHPWKAEKKTLMDVGLARTGTFSDSVKIITFRIYRYNKNDINICDVSENKLKPIKVSTVESNICSCE